MPSKLTNILAAGRPSVATAEEGTALWDVLESDGAGRCVPPDDAQALAEAITELGNDPGLRASMGRKAREYAEQNLEQDKILARFERQLNELVASRRKTSK